MKILLFLNRVRTWVWTLIYVQGSFVRKFEAWYLILMDFSLFFLQVDTYGAVYKKLTGKEVTFEFPEPYL